MSAYIPVADLKRAAQEFALPQIRIVQPSLVVCLGLATFSAIQRACGLKPSPRLAEAIASPLVFETAKVWCQAHAGALGHANRGAKRAFPKTG